MYVSIFLFCFPQGVFADKEKVQVHLPTFSVYLNGVKVENTHREYPFIVYNNITYVPLTYFDCRFMGLVSEWSKESGLSIRQQSITGGYRDYLTNKKNPQTDSATIKSGIVRINGNGYNSSQLQYPFLSYRSVTYCPLTWQFCVDDFGWSYDFGTKGLTINSKNLQLNRIKLDDINRDSSIILRDNNLFYTTDKGAIVQTSLGDVSKKNRIYQIENLVSKHTAYPAVNFSAESGNYYFDYYTGHNGVGDSHVRYKILSNNSVTPFSFYSRDVSKEFGNIVVTIPVGVPPSTGQIDITERGESRRLTLPEHFLMWGDDRNMFLQGRSLYLTAKTKAQFSDVKASKLYRIDIDTGEISLLNDLPVRQFILKESKIYLDSYGTLYEMDISGETLQKLADTLTPENTDGTFPTFAFSESTLYYIGADNCLYLIGETNTINAGAKVRTNGLQQLGHCVVAIFEDKSENITRMMAFENNKCILSSSDSVKLVSEFNQFSNISISSNKIAYCIGKDIFWFDFSSLK